MGAFFSYTLQAGIVLALGWLAYRAVVARRCSPGVCRAALVSLVAVALLLPMAAIFCPAPGDGAAAGAAAFGPAQFAGIARDDGVAGLVVRILVAVYYAGLCLFAGLFLLRLIRLMRLLRGGRRRRLGACVLVTLPGDIRPFSWMNRIVVAQDEQGASLAMIMEHELAHVRLGHSFDLLLFQLVCIVMWYNPAAWLFLGELALVHEFQADRRVLACGTDVRLYQTMLIKKAVGPRFPSLANNLNHSKLKQRITMMCKKSSKVGALLRSLTLTLVPAASLVVVGTPAVASVLGRISAAEFSGEVSSKSVVVQQGAPAKAADTLASFPGGESAMFAFLIENMRYPEAAAKAKIEGRVVVQFDVAADGTLKNVSVVRGVDPDLDAEAVRVIKSMPAWTPAMADGVPVETAYTLPVSFKLTPSAAD